MNLGVLGIIFSLFLSLIMIGGGYSCKSLADGEISDFAGYRTRKSKINKDTWREANTYFGSLFMKSGIVFLLVSLLYSILFYNSPAYMILVIVLGMLVPIFIDLYIVEKHMRNTFDTQGNRK